MAFTNSSYTLRVKALKAINIDKARPMQMGLDRGKAAQSRKTASLKVDFNGT